MTPLEYKILAALATGEARAKGPTAGVLWGQVGEEVLTFNELCDALGGLARKQWIWSYGDARVTYWAIASRGETALGAERALERELARRRR